MLDAVLLAGHLQSGKNNGYEEGAATCELDQVQIHITASAEKTPSALFAFVFKKECAHIYCTGSLRRALRCGFGQFVAHLMNLRRRRVLPRPPADELNWSKSARAIRLEVGSLEPLNLTLATRLDNGFLATTTLSA